MHALPGTHIAGNDGRPAEGGFVYKSPSSSYYFAFFSDGVTPFVGVRPASPCLRHLTPH